MDEDWCMTEGLADLNEWEVLPSRRKPTLMETSLSKNAQYITTGEEDTDAETEVDSKASSPSNSKILEGDTSSHNGESNGLEAAAKLASRANDVFMEAMDSIFDPTANGPGGAPVHVGAPEESAGQVAGKLVGDLLKKIKINKKNQNQ